MLLLRAPLPRFQNNAKRNSPLLQPDDASARSCPPQHCWDPPALLVAARRALPRSLNPRLWGGAAGEKPGVCRQDSTADRSSHPDIVCPIRQRRTNACGSFHPEASLGRTAKIAPQAARPCCCTFAGTGGARSGALDLTLDRFRGQPRSF